MEIDREWKNPIFFLIIGRMGYTDNDIIVNSRCLSIRAENGERAIMRWTAKYGRSGGRPQIRPYLVAKSQHMQPAGVGGFFFFFRDRGRTTLWYNIIMLRATIYDERAYDNNLLLREALQRIAQTCLPATRPAGRGGMGGGRGDIPDQGRLGREKVPTRDRKKKKKNIFFGRA